MEDGLYFCRNLSNSLSTFTRKVLSAKLKGNFVSDLSSAGARESVGVKFIILRMSREQFVVLLVVDWVELVVKRVENLERRTDWATSAAKFRSTKRETASDVGVTIASSSYISMYLLTSCSRDLSLSSTIELKFSEKWTCPNLASFLPRWPALPLPGPLEAWPLDDQHIPLLCSKPLTISFSSQNTKVLEMISFLLMIAIERRHRWPPKRVLVCVIETLGSVAMELFSPSKLLPTTMISQCAFTTRMAVNPKCVGMEFDALLNFWRILARMVRLHRSNKNLSLQTILWNVLRWQSLITHFCLLNHFTYKFYM